MTPTSLFGAAIESLPSASVAELEFQISAAETAQDVWTQEIIYGLAGLIASKDLINYGKLRGIITKKFSKDVNETLFTQAIKQARQDTAVMAPRTPDQMMPDIQINDRPMRDQSLDVIQALRAKNQPPQLFARAGAIAAIIADEKSRPTITTLTENQLRGRMDRAANFIRRGEASVRVEAPPMDIVKDLMALPPFDWGFPTLEALVEVPTLRVDGSILMNPGYDQQSGLYYIPADGFHMPEVPDDLNMDDVDGAVGAIDEAFSDFPMANTASRANYFALLLTPVIRPAIKGCVPMALIDAPQPGTGKSLLADVFATITTGRPAPMLPFPKQDEEMSKSILAGLMAGRPIVCFDNLEGAVQSPVLCLALTAREYEGRQLGATKMLNVVNRCTWLATGNNIRPVGDMVRRCYQIRIDARSSSPHASRRFRHPDLLQWVGNNRALLLRSLLILARAWWLAGKPEVDTEPLGSFEEWHRIIGGILQHCGIDGFLENRNELAENDDDVLQWERFIDDIGCLYMDGMWWRVKDIGRILRTADQTSITTVPDSVSEYLDPRKPETTLDRVLGRAMMKRKGRRYGDKGLYLERKKQESAAEAWFRVMSTELDLRTDIARSKPG